MQHPDIPVILNHLGCLKLTGKPEEDEAATSLWRQGMTALAAAGSHVFVKISMLSYIDKAWDTPASPVPGLVHEILQLFGSQR